jgi:DNA repair protein RadA/Sms
VRIEEPGADLAIALAIASAARGVPVREGYAAFGEIGLTGRLRPASQAERRLAECRKLGVTAAVAPAGTPGDGANGASKPRVLGAETLRAAIRHGLVPRSETVEVDETGEAAEAALLTGS